MIAASVAAFLLIRAAGEGLPGPGPGRGGAAFRMGAEAESEFGEKFAPSKEYGELLGHSLYFYSKDTGRPVAFTPPSWALQGALLAGFEVQLFANHGGHTSIIHRGCGVE